MNPLIFLLTCALGGIAGIALLNRFWFPRLPQAAAEDPDPPAVWVLIPARNEARTIVAAISGLRAQRFERWRLFVLDDQSDDGTAAIARAAAGGDPRISVLCGQLLPPDWVGKAWACQQLAAAAAAAGARADDLLLFTDADVSWEPAALGAVLAEFRRSAADLLSVWPTQITVTPTERMIVPMMALAVQGYLPYLLVTHLPMASAAAANGQCLLFRKQAYDRIGGHRAVQHSVLDDVTLARATKRSGGRLAMADAGSLLHCRMYHGRDETLNGFAKNILAGHGDNVFWLLVSTLFHLGVYFVPALWLAAGVIWPLPGWPLQPLLLLGLGMAARAITAAGTGQRWYDAWTLPLATCVMTYIALRSLWWHYFGGGLRWRGRTIKKAVTSDGK
jgi:chlorobactene glucosyltransferase